ncbi:hypothetical protein C900_01909 [Fulvivirga imtechensis AK7]|uniref:RCK C-terminal domain-containing protein n=2 Tax=Fulvivirga TaxID=396811 RepID=L8JWP5_9BACT|nr:hypothetical protein C900_01909 [Fulvivirga imtechensis AK7]
MIKRNGNFLTPKGATVLEPLDTLIVLSENEEGIDLVHESLNLNNNKT